MPPARSCAAFLALAAPALALIATASCKRGGDPAPSPPPTTTASHDATPTTGTAGTAAPGPVVLPTTQLWPDRRTPCDAPAFTGSSWKHTRSKMIAAAGSPRHVAADTIVAAGSAPQLDGKFAYGSVSKDIEDETVLSFTATGGCTSVPGTSALTDDDGRSRATAAVLPAGYHHFWLRLAGDGSHAQGGIWVVPPATPAILFDVDGTLTTDDGELFDDLLGRGVAEVFPNAAAVAQRWAAKGYLIVYVTGRPYPLRDHTRRWLESHGFPYGPLFTPDRFRDARPTRDGVGDFKREILLELQSRGVSFARAYGNAATDVCAYVQAKIPPAITFIIGARAGCDGSPAPQALPGYVDHMPSVDAFPDAR
jgi:hypothetical protein